MSKKKIIGLICIIILLITGLIYSIVSVATIIFDDKMKSDTSNDKTKSGISDDKTKSDISDDETKSDISDDETKSDTSDDETKSDTSDDKIKSDTSDYGAQSDLEPKGIVKKYLDNIKSLDVSEASKYTVDNISNFEDIKLEINKEDTSIAHYNTFFKKMMDYDYKVGDTEINGDTASVQITLKTYNFTTAIMNARLHITDSKLANDFSGNHEDEEEIAQRELAKILDPMKRKLEIPVKLNLIKTEGGWKIDNECIKEDLTYAIAGNLVNSINYYCEYYEDPSKYDGSISMDSYEKFLESNGIIYDENSKTSPFKKQN